jgi:hypothetical protein
MTIGYLTGRYLCRNDKCRETPPKAENTAPLEAGFREQQAVASARRQFCESIASDAESSSRCANMH